MEKTKNITKEELKYLIVAEESAKSKEERFRYFEHTLECLFFGLDTPTDREDDFLVSDIKQSIIVFAMADTMLLKSWKRGILIFLVKCFLLSYSWKTFILRSNAIF